MPERLPHPGPSFLREQEVRIDDRRLLAGMAKPVDGPDDWWLAVMWVVDDDGVVSFRDVAPAGGPPPEPPLMRLGPSLAGSLSGVILEENGRIQLRLTPLVPPEDDARPWRCPLAIRAAFRFEPALVQTMRSNQLAEQVLAGFRRAVESLHRP
ncbi:MAG TPA: hypothetical protein VFY23_04565 [Candidatus Limnocylindrales bacterium]|nr:hypothetical protein [Candidatus Limnocylindrales bacterium]